MQIAKYDIINKKIKEGTAMAKNLLITEKPSVAMECAKALRFLRC